MKKLLTHTLCCMVMTFSAQAGNFFGSAGGPWANGWYYPGQMDGKYQASITGVNITGALGFAFQNGSPTVPTNVTTTNSILLDASQNYFVVFVQGMTYRGTTTATINVDQNTVTGALYSGQNEFDYLELITIVGTGSSRLEEQSYILNNLPLLNRGVNGGFEASINSKKAVFTFSGQGELSSPAFPQTVQGFDTNGNFVPPSQFISNAVTVILETATVPFDIQGIKVSN